MVIKNEAQYREYKEAMEVIITQGTNLGDMELLPQSDKEEFIRLTDAISEWEAAYHPLPGKISSLITDEIKKRMENKRIKQKEAAKMLGISESRVSELLNSITFLAFLKTDYYCNLGLICPFLSWRA